MTASRRAAYIAGFALMAAMGFLYGNVYATRNNDILVKYIAAERHSAEVLEVFTQVLKTTDFCDGAKP
jgi:hypothetical protein